jgi:fibronectin-binding autotransporter adhesin
LVTLTATDPQGLSSQETFTITVFEPLTLTWNPGGLGGGDGVWSSAAANWSDGVSALAWPGGLHDGTFAGSAGAVTVAQAGVGVRSLRFSTSGYQVSGGPITLGLLGTIEADADVVATIGSAVGGSVGLTKRGAGILALTGDKNYTGPTNIEGGVLDVGALSGSFPGGNVNLSGSAVLQARGSFSRTVGTGDTQIRWSGAGGFAAKGGDLTVTLGTGTVSWAGAGPGFHSGLIFGSADADGKVTVTTNIGLNNSNRTITVVGNTVAEITGNLTQGGTQANSRLTKQGTGTLILSGTNTYGTAYVGVGTNILNGTLLVNGSIPAGTGTVAVAGPATLGGTGTIGAATTVTGTLAPGAGRGTLTFGSSLTLNATATLGWEIDAANQVNDLVVVGGNLALGGTLNVTGAGNFSAVNAGSWRLFNYSGTLSGELAIGTGPSLPLGYGWAIDTTTAGQVNLVVVQVAIPSPLRAWRQLYFNTDANEGSAADSADPDGDGIVNLVEFALGGDPTQAGDALWSVAQVGNDLVLSYELNEAALADVEVVAQWASDLVGGEWSSVGVTDALVSQAGGIQTREARVEATGDRKFMRLRVTLK